MKEIHILFVDDEQDALSASVASYKRHQPQTAEQLISMAIDHSTVTQQSESIMYECEKEGEA